MSPHSTLTTLCNRSAGGHIPYRDSLLTRLLQPALSGKSRVAIICTISPDLENYSESHNTLKFAGDAKKIVTKAERGVVSPSIRKRGSSILIPRSLPARDGPNDAAAVCDPG
jgi:hypothetical protein